MLIIFYKWLHTKGYLPYNKSSITISSSRDVSIILIFNHHPFYRKKYNLSFIYFAFFDVEVLASKEFLRKMKAFCRRVIFGAVMFFIGYR